MKHNLELLKADVLDELAKIEKLVNDFHHVEHKLARVFPQPCFIVLDLIYSFKTLGRQVMGHG